MLVGLCILRVLSSCGRVAWTFTVVRGCGKMTNNFFFFYICKISPFPFLEILSKPWLLADTLLAEWSKGEEPQSQAPWNNQASYQEHYLCQISSLISPLFVPLAETCRVTGSPHFHGSSSRRWVFGNCKFGLEDHSTSRVVVAVGWREMWGSGATWGWVCTWRGSLGWVTQSIPCSVRARHRLCCLISDALSGTFLKKTGILPLSRT